MNIRVGIGYDVHKLCKNRKLIIGGVDIPFDFGLLGHSDADVLIHAIIDALLGACGLGDIGEIFPDSDMSYKGISSMVLLKNIKNICDIINIDSVIIAQEPKLAPFRKQMIKNIADTLEIDESRINIKATTEEGLGFTGRKEGIAAHAVVLVQLYSCFN